MIKIQWDNLTDFAKRMLNCMGLTSLKDYQNLEDKYYVSLNSIHKLARQRADSFPFVIDPEVQILDNRLDNTKAIRLTTKNLQYVLDRYVIDALQDPEFKAAFVRGLSIKWIRQTDDAINEIMEKWNENA